VSGYGYQGRGIVSLQRSNVDSIFPNAPEAQRRKASGTFTDAPFLSPAGLFSLPIPAEFIGAGDFDADGHWDVVAASRTRSYLILFSGDGRGSFAAAREIDLPGIVTAMTTGEINRSDGLTDVVVGVALEQGAQVLVFEGPEGALRSNPEAFRLPSPPTGLVLARLNEDYLIDLGAAAGSEVFIVEGRDRKSSLDEASQAEVAQAKVTRQPLPFAVTAISVGNFTGDQDEELALLGDDGSLHLLTRPRATDIEKEGGAAARWTSELWATGPWSDAARLISARVSTSGADDLLVIDKANDQLQIVTKDKGEIGETADRSSTTTEKRRGRVAASLNATGGSRAVLPMRLNADALSDLVVLQSKQTAASILTTAAAATFTVNSKEDTNDGICDLTNCTLREAIIAANANSGLDLINFNIAQGGPQTITPLTALPTITGPVTIDGTTQPGFSGTPIIELNGSIAPNGTNGLLIMGGNTTVRGLVINRFHNGDAIEFQTNGGNVVEGNFLGTNLAGNALANVPPEFVRINRSGVFINGPSNNRIGGTTDAARNLLSGNTQGIFLSGLTGINTTGNLVQGNLIGTNAAGTGDLGNGTNGIDIFRTAVSTIGGTSAGARNIISGNDNSGIGVQNTNGNLVQGNHIGTDITGTVDLGNAQSGVSTTSGSFDTYGGTTPAARNIISGNNGQGMLIRGEGNFVQGNFIGTNVQGSGAIGNTLNGVATSDAPNNTIGGATAAARNIISANGQNGVSIGLDLANGSTGITVRNNYIGTDVNGLNCLGNLRDGVVVNRGAVSHTVADNLITCNGRNGVNIPNAGASDPAIRIEVTNNSIFANALLGIDLGEAGITANDPGDPDGGANFQQNFPVLTSFGLGAQIVAETSPGKSAVGAVDVRERKSVSQQAAVTVNGTLNSTPGTTFTVHWYFSGDSQCVTNQPSSRPLATGKIPGVTTDGNGNAPFSFPFDFPNGTSSGIINCTATDPDGNTSEFSACLPVATWQPVVLTAQQISQLKAWTVGGRTYVYVKPEFPNAGYRVVNWGQAARSGNDFTVDANVERFPGASIQAVVTTAQIYDLGPLANGTYNFNFKTSGTLAKTLQFTVSSTVPPPNPIDDARQFVKQQYRDFLNREADQAGEDFWTDNITKCNDPARRPPGQTVEQCTLRQRETTSGAFFLSPEFQYTGYFVYRMYQGGLGRQPKLSEFIVDAQFVGNGIVVGGQLSGAKINQNKAAFAALFVNCADATKYRCAEFKAIYDALNNQQYVDKLFQTTGVDASASDRTALVNGLTGGTETRASVLQKVVDGINVISEGNQQFTTTYGQAFYNSEFNRAFVQLQYFGYMKRDPDDAGYAFWLGKLNQFGGNFVNAEMVLAFISSPEYRARFGQP
jgi:CSLREA domain-containing protein